MHDNCGLNLCRLALGTTFFSRELSSVLSLGGKDCDTVSDNSEVVAGTRSAIIVKKY